MIKILLSLIMVLSMMQPNCFAEISSSKAKYLKKGTAYIKLSNDKTGWLMYPSAIINKLTGNNGMYLDFSTSGVVKVLNADTSDGVLSCITPYGTGKFKTNMDAGSGGFYTLYLFTTLAYKPIQFLTVDNVSGTGYVTWADNDSSVGSCFIIGANGAGKYNIIAELEGSGSANMGCYAAVAINGTVDHNSTSYGYFTLTGGRCIPAIRRNLVSGDKVSLVFCKRGSNANDNVSFREVSFRIERVSQ